VLAVAQSWPLPLHLATHLTGNPAGDAGVYVWNLWIFSHELFNADGRPLSTLEILPLAGPVDLSLHNYTIFADLLAVPLLRWLDIISTFNVIYLVNVALAGFGMFLLARRLTGRAPESFLAGLMFAWAPFLVTRGNGHYSLTAAAPLPLFMLALYQAWETRRLRDAILTGAVLAWASFCDPYYAVYCVMLGTAFVVTRTVDVSLMRRSAKQLRAARNLLNVALVLVLGLIIGVNLIGGGRVRIGAFQISVRTLYTPMLVLTLLALARIAIATNLRITALPRPSRPFMVRAAMAGGIVAVLLMSPTLYAVGVRVIEGRMPSTPVYWRSSPAGVDLISFLVPNPNHPLAPAALKAAVGAGAGGYVEQVASLSWIGALVLFAAWRFASFRPGRFWPWLTALFALLSMGPFLQIAGFTTYIPGPWALLRSVPLVGAARMPGRMSIVVTMGFCVLFAAALVALTRRYPQRRALLLSVVGVLLVAELQAAPRALFPVDVPRVYQTVADDPRPVRVLTLPTGVRDGVAPIGNLDASTQFYQAFHGKGLVGGYLSRVSARRKEAYRQMPVMGALLDVSEGRTLHASQIDRAVNGADAFLKSTNLGYVIMQEGRVSAPLRDLASSVLGLRKIAEADGYSLYVPRRPD
jgi:hypothetical protein